MANSSVTIPSRVSIERAAGVSRETLPHGQLTRAAASELLPRLMTEVDFNATMGSVGTGMGPAGESAVLTADLVDRFRKSIWPPPSVPAFGSWPSPGDVLDRAVRPNPAAPRTFSRQSSADASSVAGVFRRRLAKRCRRAR